MFDLQEFISDRLDKIYKYPKMWGTKEAIELQIILLLEIRVKDMYGITFRIMDYYTCWQRTVLDGISTIPMSHKVETHEELIEVMKKFEEYISINAKKDYKSL